MAETLYISAVDTAKLVRKDLKAAFPGIKFSVRTDTYSMGASIDIHWQDGPTADEVQKVVARYEGSRFDGMTDYKENVYQTDEQGRRVHYGSDYIHTHRHYSAAFLEPVARQVAKDWGIETFNLVDRRSWDDKWDDAYIERDYTQKIGDCTFADYVLHEAASVSAYRRDHQPAPQPEPAGDAPHISSYKGNPILVLPLEDGRAFKFGLTKAQALLEHLEAVRAFAEGGVIPTSVDIEMYNGAELLVLPNGHYPFKFGKSKAQAVIQHAAAVEAFVSGDTLPEPPQPPTPPEPPAPSREEAEQRAARFQELGNNLAEKIEAKRNPAIAQLPPTRRRMSIIESMRLDARALEEVQAALYALADAWQEGTIPGILQGLRDKTQVEHLLRMPSAPEFRDTQAFKRMQRAGLGDSRACAAAKEALQQLLSPDIGQPTVEEEIRRLEMEARLIKIPGYFPTPEPVVERLLRLANILPGERVLEPSAGNGNIADAIRAQHPEADLEVIEISPDLREILELKGHNLVAYDFTNHAGEYDTVVMNPPFENGQDIDHVRRAFYLLKPGGRVVAIMSEGVFFRKDRQATEFRGFLQDFGYEAQRLPAGTFMQSGTMVASRIVVLEKPALRVQPAAPQIQPEPAPAPREMVLAHTAPADVPAEQLHLLTGGDNAIFGNGRRTYFDEEYWKDLPLFKS